jgi:hypothetical protein
VENPNRNRNLLIALLGAAAMLCLCCSLVIGAASVASFWGAADREGTVDQAARVVTRIVTPTPRPLVLVTPEAPEALEATPAAEGESAGVEPMDPAEVEVPQRDLRELALRLKDGVTDIPVVVNDAPPSYELGDRVEFWVSNSDTQKHNKVTAELRYMTDHLYMWVQEGVDIAQSDLEASANRFETETYPTNREFFGSEWTPGVDNDPRLSILHARGLGRNVAGYYSSADEFSKLVNPYSNEREMFYISAEPGAAEPNSAFYDGTLAHEFQHMIHWANDRNEDSWVNEGMSELASFLNDYDPGGADVAFMQQPDTQLNTWADPSEGNVEHYGASYLFMNYFLDRFGEELTKAVVASPRNGIAGFNDALEQAGRTERFDDIFADWVVANYFDQPDAGLDGEYGYQEIDPARPAVIETHRRFPADGRTQVNQYATDYIELRDRDDFVLSFEGQTQNMLVDAELKDELSWWSNRGDDSNSRLTRAFDLRDVSAATLNFSAWYNIEEGWDYAYVAVSTDGGEEWKLLPGRHTTEENPVGNAFGAGWTGKSGGGDEPVWVEESVDLTPYAGQEVLVRFEYVTDDAVNEAGFLLDDIALPEIGYRDGGEDGLNGWESEGWLLTDNTLDQNWLVQLIRADGSNVSVQPVEVGPDGRGQLQVQGLGRDETVILAVSGLTPFTTVPATYSYAIEQQ